MKKIIILVLGAITILSACTKNLSTLNVNPKAPSVVPSYTLFTYAEHELSNTMVNSNVNDNIFRLIEQQWEETTYTDESNYNILSRTIPDNDWNLFYSTILVNLEQAKKLIPTDVSDAAQQKNEIAIADILEVYSYFYLVTTYGNIPYSQALDISKPFPAYDDQKTVYYQLIDRLSADITVLDANSAGASFGGADIIYSGAPSAWAKFGNTFKVKMGMVLADYDPAKSQSTVNSAIADKGGIFGSNADNALFAYLGASPNTNPIWVDLVQSGRQDFVANSFIMQYLVSPKDSITVLDPRLPYFFTTVNVSDPKYIGLDPGANGAFGDYSKPSGPLLISNSVGSITNPDFPGDLLDYAELQLNLAEAASRTGYTSVTSTAAVYYAAGVTASIAFWTGSEASAATYLTAHPVGTGLNAIALQKYLALYNRGWDIWIEDRRLDYPILTAPKSAEYAYPIRFTYPINEQQVNIVNYTAAAKAIGGDDVTTKLFWDVN